MNDLIFVMYNTKLKDKRAKSENNQCNLEDVSSDDEWLTVGQDIVGSSNINLLNVIDDVDDADNRDRSEDQCETNQVNTGEI